jgi:STE24 endopeptidase
LEIHDCHPDFARNLGDTYALQTTRNPQAFISAMTRLANQNLADAEPPAWVEFLLHSHPSIGKRVAMVEKFLG